VVIVVAISRSRAERRPGQHGEEADHRPDQHAAGQGHDQRPGQGRGRHPDIDQHIGRETQAQVRADEGPQGLALGFQLGQGQVLDRPARHRPADQGGDHQQGAKASQQNHRAHGNLRGPGSGRLAAAVYSQTAPRGAEK
jgi:hypothetical protein